MYRIRPAVVGALDYRDNVHGRYNVCNLVVFKQLAVLIDRLVLAPKPLFAHELERKNDVPLGVDAKHIADHEAALDLVLRHVQYVTRPRLGFNSQQGAVSIVDCDNVRQAGATSAKTTRLPFSAVEPLDQCVFIRITPAAADISQAASVGQLTSLKFLRGKFFIATCQL